MKRKSPVFFSRKVEPHNFYLSKEELANSPDFFQEGLMAEILFAEGRDGEQSIKNVGSAKLHTRKCFKNESLPRHPGHVSGYDFHF